ncbi:MAG: glutaredoxin family protein [Hylemonella sp.]|nr:glutaredoxin family protein [Hylemonella sp.]MDP1939010.1 glutaredoxin family protein [Hylemonella sp.]
MKRSLRQHPATLAAASLLLALTASLAQAQGIYRIVGPDGRVTFSDKPPATSDKATALSADGRAESAAASALPYELQQLTRRYPVTLYSGDNCAPCDSGRALLNNRGIPFTERTVSTPQDTDALQKLNGDASIPVLTIGGQRLQGFMASDWAQYLDAAGYPKSSQLPANYRNPAPAPLVPPPPPIPATANGKQPAAAPNAVSPRAPTVTPDNPAGITF